MAGKERVLRGMGKCNSSLSANAQNPTAPGSDGCASRRLAAGRRLQRRLIGHVSSITQVRPLSVLVVRHLT
jgi:hypothetical protein